jgi:hypothetical protein
MIILANVMIPTIAEHIIIMLILLVPVSFIEAIILALRHVLKYRESLKLSFYANIKSTLIGLPIGYAFAFIGLIPAGIFASILPKNIGSVIGNIFLKAVAHGGTIPSKFDEIGFYLGILLVMIPYYFVTIRIERKVIVKYKAELNTPSLTRTVWIMNGITYGLLAIPVVYGATGAVTKYISNK